MIKYLILDVDGTLTDGKVYIGNDGEIMKAFSIKDGYGIGFLLKKMNITPVIITGRISRIVENRCLEIGITNIFQGVINKIECLENFVGKTKLGECAYIGDDILDLQCMEPIKAAGGLVGCPADAVKDVREISDYVCGTKGGEGAVREFIEWLVKYKVVKQNADLKVRVEKAIKYISSLDHKNLKVGTFHVSDDFFYIVKEIETQSRERCIFESHRKYIDIQWVVEGQMAIETADIATLNIEKEYDSEKDVTLWVKKDNLMKTVLTSGSYAVLFPNNCHISAIAINNQPQKVKLIVGKVRI